MSKPDINPSNYMQAKYSAALASYLGKANLSVAKFLQTRLTPETDRILSDQLSHILASVPNPENLNDRPYIRLLRMELCFLHIRQKLLPRADIPTVQERS